MSQQPLPPPPSSPGRLARVWHPLGRWLRWFGERMLLPIASTNLLVGLPVTAMHYSAADIKPVVAVHVSEASGPRDATRDPAAIFRHLPRDPALRPPEAAARYVGASAAWPTWQAAAPPPVVQQIPDMAHDAHVVRIPTHPRQGREPAPE